MASTVRIVFLGTGATRPSKRRNVSSVALQLDGSIILMDVGEGTQHRFLSANASPMKVNYIFLSHLHGDHFLGLTPLLQSMAFLGRRRPIKVMVWEGNVEEILKAINLGYSSFTYPIEVLGVRAGQRVELDGFAVSFEEALHGVPALMIRVDEPRGRSVVYTGDTLPSKRTVEFARGASVLIHDSLSASDREEFANSYGHSSSRQAAEVARKAGVQLLVLTHISQAYDGREEELLLEAREVFPNTVLAQDLMEIVVRTRPPHRVEGGMTVES